MKNNIEKNFAVFIVGPTGVGKTKVSIEIGCTLHGEIISADSRQFYRDMDIGTDKPSSESLKRVRHHFVNILNPDDYYTAGQFGKDARKTIGEVLSRNKLPIIVGGSGLYIKAILEGFFDETERDIETKKMLQKRAAENGTSDLYNELKLADPEFAAKISVNDAQRIIRGLEVFIVTGKSLTHHWKKAKANPCFIPVIIGLRRERSELYELINSRVDTMIEKGLVEEVKALREKRYSTNLNALKTFGYREVNRFLNNESSYDDMVEEIKKSTRNYAKRQLTWFKKLEKIRWVTVSDNSNDAVGNVLSIIQDQTG